MFQISIIEDKAVRILPQNLALKQLEAVTQQLEATYIDKVIPELGLAVTLYEVLRIDGGAVHPGEGSALFTVLFSLVIFRPFLGEVLTGRIKSSSKSGVQISLGFFEDVHVPPKLMQEPSFFCEGEQPDEQAHWKWVWEENDMHMDNDEEIRFRVDSVLFPPRPTSTESLSKLTPLEGGAPGPAFAPMVIVGDLSSDSGSGLGMLSWWAAPEEEEPA